MVKGTDRGEINSFEFLVFSFEWSFAKVKFNIKKPAFWRAFSVGMMVACYFRPILLN